MDVTEYVLFFSCNVRTGGVDHCGVLVQQPKDAYFSVSAISEMVPLWSPESCLSPGCHIHI